MPESPSVRVRNQMISTEPKRGKTRRRHQSILNAFVRAKKPVKKKLACPYQRPRQSSSVEMSPGSMPISFALRMRRTILPLRVLGRESVNSISDGMAMGPSVIRTW